MSLNLPIAPGKYDPGNEAQTRTAIAQADAQNVKRQEVTNKLLFKDTVTGEVRTLTIASGSVVIT